MLRRRLICGSAAASALLLAAYGPAAFAQDATTVEEVTVTGSLIGGTPEDAAIPVQVIGFRELERQGSPSALELIKTLPIIGPVLGDTNQFSVAAQGRNGGGTINLRGLGANRTLVLLNGRRFAGYTSDTNLLPLAAIGRVEILKDGAAATYGSDAIGGVANFITRSDFRGAEVAADYRFVDGSDGDYTGSALFGWGNDRMSVMAAIGYQHRSELRSTDRRWSSTDGGINYLRNPSGWSPYANPGAWSLYNVATPQPNPLAPGYTPPLNAVGSNAADPAFRVVRDANCTETGGFAGWSGIRPVCYWTYVPFDNLVEDQNQLQVYAEANYHISDTTRLHFEVLYAETDQPHVSTSPGYAPFSGPNGPSTTYTFFVPSTNPGFNTFLTQTGNAALIGTAVTAGEFLWRPLSNGGNGMFLPGRGSQLFYRYYETWHAAASLRGELGWGVRYDASLTYIQENQDQRTSDIIITRLQRALSGLGGPGCTGNTPGANGCQYFNPFSNAFAGNPTLGLTNPGFVPANANSAALTEWLFDQQVFQAWQDTWVADVVLSGQLGWRLWGGPVGWAFGGQYRMIDYSQRVSPDTYNADLFPCPVAGQPVGPPTPPGCPVATGPFIFLGQNRNLDLSQNVWAVFGELQLPITDTIDSQLAVRYERYSGNTGSTTNPQFRIKWQALDWFALRASVGTSFRGPTAGNTIATGATGLSGLNATAGAFRAVDFIGNPNVGPETALTYSVGAIVRAGNLTATLDYWKYRLEDQITSVPSNLIASAVAPGATGFQLANCAHPLVALNLVTFNGGVCTQGVTVGNDISRVRSDTTNGPTIETDGIDFDFNYRMTGVLNGGTLDVGGSISYILHYEIAPFIYQGITVSPTYDAVGFTNYDRQPGTIPRWRGQLYLDYANGPHNLRITTNYTDGVTDNRGPTVVQTGPTTNCSVANVTAGTAINCHLITSGSVVGAFTQVDATYRLVLPTNTTFTLTVQNVFDQDPSAARLELNYDPFIGSALGRTVKIGIRQGF
jgi:iron complex outermembrane receptor protein